MVFRGIHLQRPDVSHRRVHRVAITSAAGVPVQLDGDPGGTLGEGGSAWTAEAVPGAIDVLVPSSYPLADAS
jgi:diacylglycerol kinase (ATP)